METPVYAPFKEKVRLEIVKLREMSFKEKVEHIWEYYKFILLGLVVFLIIIGSLINAWLINPQPKTALLISWNTGYVLHEQLDELSEALTKQLVDEKENEVVSTTQILTSTDDPTINMASQQRMIAMVAAGEIDVFILDSKMLVEYAGNGLIVPIESMLTEIRSIDKAAYDRIEEGFVNARFESEEGQIEEAVMGVSLENCRLLLELDYYQEDLIFSLCATSCRQENVKAALIAFFE